VFFGFGGGGVGAIAGGLVFGGFFFVVGRGWLVLGGVFFFFFFFLGWFWGFFFFGGGVFWFFGVFVVGFFFWCVVLGGGGGGLWGGGFGCVLGSYFLLPVWQTLPPPSLGCALLFSWFRTLFASDLYMGEFTAFFRHLFCLVSLSLVESIVPQCGSFEPFVSGFLCHFPYLSPVVGTILLAPILFFLFFCSGKGLKTSREFVTPRVFFEFFSGSTVLFLPTPPQLLPFFFLLFPPTFYAFDFPPRAI